MKTSAKLAVLFATGSLLLAGSPAFAASVATTAFVTNIHPNIDFLNSSSRLAIDSSTNPRIRRFARAEATQQTIAGNSVVAWIETNSPNGEVVALGGDTPAVAPYAPVASLALAPLDVATAVTGDVVNGVSTVTTGRSVAIDNPPPLTVTPVVPVVVAPGPTPTPGYTLLPSEQTDLSHLRASSGAAFDRLYVATQSDALHQLAGLYADYIQNGDDPALRALAVRELPKINRRIAELPRI